MVPMKKRVDRVLNSHLKFGLFLESSIPESLTSNISKHKLDDLSTSICSHFLTDRAKHKMFSPAFRAKGFKNMIIGYQ